MNDWQEVLLTSLGFDWQVANNALADTYFSTANLNGLYTQDQVQALHIGTPMLTRYALNGTFKLTIAVKKSADLIEFLPFPLQQSGTTVNAQGEIEQIFTVPDDSAFFLLQAK